jgi:putative DNA primase/helicase
MNIKPNIDFAPMNVTDDDIKSDIAQIEQTFAPILHTEILRKLIAQLDRVDFRELADFVKDDNKELKKKHLLVIAIEQILQTAERNNWGLCRANSFIYLYNGAYWRLFDSEEVKAFLGEAAEKIGVEKFEARYFKFRTELYQQFLASANLTKPEPQNDTVLINLKNGTFEISPTKQVLRTPQRTDFMTYQLPFEYNEAAKAPLFMAYLDKVQPCILRQNILAEYLAYVFVKPSTLKLEKALFLYGSGANGKSVFADIVDRLLGAENVSHYSLASITDENGYHRAKLAGKMVNYASEIKGKLEASIFKQLVTGEPVEARLPYQEPFIMTDYAKLIFNCNELPKETELTHAFFRRFLIIPFDVTIPESEQDKTLAQKIIDTELSGVFNWVLDGLHRLLKQKSFTHCAVVQNQTDEYKKQSDSVLTFIEDEDYTKSKDNHIPLKSLHAAYLIYCNSNGFRSLSMRKFAEGLRRNGYDMEKRSIGQVVFLAKMGELFTENQTQNNNE